MADVIIDPENKNAKELLSQGIRAYVLQDFTTAVTALGKASELLVTEHGDDLHDSLGDVYCYYGKALLALSRQESEPLGDAIPKGDNEEEGEDGDDDDEEGENEEVADNSVNEEKAKSEENEKTSQKGSAATPVEAQPTEKSENGEEKMEASASTSNEDGKEAETENDEPTDLQLAWEVLELAKKIFEKRGSEGKKQLAETLTTLGEISLESENFEAAIVDIKDGLAIQEEIFPNDSRKVAETCYNLGIAYSTNSQLDEAIEAFNKSLKYLNKRIENLEKAGNGEEEIKEIKELIPELNEKIADMKTYKEETIKKLAELTKQPEIVKKISENGSSSSKQVNDISHLVKRKRKAEDDHAEGAPAKKSPT